MSKSFSRVHLVLYQDGKSADNEKASCCESHGGSMLGSPFKEELSLQCKELFTSATLFLGSPSQLAYMAGLLGLIISAQTWAPLMDQWLCVDWLRPYQICLALRPP